MRPPKSWVWLLALFTMASLVEGFSLSHMTAFVPLYLPDLGVSQSNVPEVTGRLVAFSTAIGVPFMPFWGALADRFARQPVIVRSFVFYVLALTVALLAGNIWIFAAGRALMSFAMGNTGLMLTTLTERAPSGRMGLTFAIVQGALPIGALVGPLVGGPIVDAWGFRTLLAIDGVLMACVVLAMSFGYRDDFVPSRQKSILRMAADSLGIILMSPRLRAVFPSLFVLFAGYGLAITYAPLAIIDLYDGPNAATAIGLVLGTAALLTIVVGPSIGMLADRVGHRRVLFSALIAQSALLVLPAMAPNLVVFAVIWALLSGISTGTTALAFGVLSSSATTDVRGRVMSLSTMPMIVGLMLGSAIGSFITRESAFAAFPVAAGLTAIGLGALAVALRRGPRDVQGGQG